MQRDGQEARIHPVGTRTAPARKPPRHIGYWDAPVDSTDHSRTGNAPWATDTVADSHADTGLRIVHDYAVEVTRHPGRWFRRS